jgi:DNA mismatch endonuclease (patch repair protein)
MQRQRVRDTAPELALRRLLHARGLRYRVDTAPLPGMRRRADLVFRPSRVAVFVDGCFWHGCPQHGSRATHANPSYWSAKVANNQQRDRETDARLSAKGWLSLRIWEHEPPAEAAERVARAVTVRRPRLPPTHGADRMAGTDLLARTLQAVATLGANELLANVTNPDGDILQFGQWIQQPTEASACCEEDWYRSKYGDVPAIDLNWREPAGASSVWPIHTIHRDGTAVVVTGPRGTLRLVSPG